MPGIEPQKNGAPRTSGSVRPPSDPRFSSACGSRGHRPPCPPPPQSFLSPHPYNSILPLPIPLPGAFPNSSELPRRDGDSPQSRARRAEVVQRQPRLLTLLAFINLFTFISRLQRHPQLLQVRRRTRTPSPSYSVPVTPETVQTATNQRGWGGASLKFPCGGNGQCG